MKILEVIPKLQSGGAEKFVVDLSNEFASMGHECLLVTLYDYDEDCIFDGLVSDGVQKIRLGKKTGFDIRMYAKLYRLIKRETPDVVHVHVGAIKYIVLSAILGRSTKYFATIHSEAKREAGQGLELYSRRLLFGKGLTKPITISAESELSFERFYGRKASIIYNGCSDYIPSAFNESGYHTGVKFIFVHAARFQPVKNQLMLVQTFDRLIKEGVDLRLLLMGRIEDNEIFESIKPYFSDRIVYIGEQSDCRHYMAMADAFCLASFVEAMPITVIEAFSVGCVPIVTPAGGCVSMVSDGNNGFISDGFDMESYYASLRKFLICSERLPDLKINARRTYLEKYSIASCASNYVDAFKMMNYDID